MITDRYMVINSCGTMYWQVTKYNLWPGSYVIQIVITVHSYHLFVSMNLTI